MGRFKILKKILENIQIASFHLFITCFSFLTADVLIKYYIEDNSLIVNIIIKKVI
jgi:hypothetical protein